MAKRAENAGIQMLTIHGRTRCQFYKGKADWNAIAPIVDAVEIPVIANGDIVDEVTAKAALDASGAAGVMVGRGAQGQPWKLAQIAADLYGLDAPQVPTGNVFMRLIIEHYEAMLRFYGETLGNRVARKHLGWYMDQFSPDAELRKQVLRARDHKSTIALIERCFDEMDEVAA